MIMCEATCIQGPIFNKNYLRHKTKLFKSVGNVYIDSPSYTLFER